MHAVISSSSVGREVREAHQTREPRATTRGSGSAQVEALNRLLTSSATELETLYRSATTPGLEDVHGDLCGRMLAWPVLESRPRLANALRGFAGARYFPWNGKSFTPPSAGQQGEGINRVLSERARLFRFETFIGKSRAGDFDALQLDYDLPGNPPIIRSIKDEIRELSPGLWLGQAYLQTSTRELLWLYFGLAVKGEAESEYFGIKSDAPPKVT